MGNLFSPFHKRTIDQSTPPSTLGKGVLLLRYLSSHLGEDDRRHQIPKKPWAVGLDGLHERFLEEQRYELIPVPRPQGTEADPRVESNHLFDTRKTLKGCRTQITRRGEPRSSRQWNVRKGKKMFSITSLRTAIGLHQFHTKTLTRVHKEVGAR